MTPDPITKIVRIGVLISGRGSNLQALVSATRNHGLDASIVVVISNQEHCAGLDVARRAGIEALFISHQGWPSRADFDRVLARELKSRGVELLCLAGFMRRIGPPLLDAFPNRILNIHPSLLPSFPGLDAQQQAIAHGVKVTGVTVHIVTPDLDAGPIVVQRTVPVLDDDTPQTLGARILEQEHLAYPEAVKLMIEDGWRIEGRRFVRQKATE